MEMQLAISQNNPTKDCIYTWGAADFHQAPIHSVHFTQPLAFPMPEQILS